MNLMLACAALASLIHVGFFFLESLLFTKPPGRKVFGTTPAEAETMKFLAFNQGFYNLFIAIGCMTGIAFVVSGRVAEGRALIAFACATMVGAAAILATGGKKFVRGVLGQSLPAVGALVGLAIS